jgi:hypothetical protein
MGSPSWEKPGAGLSAGQPLISVCLDKPFSNMNMRPVRPQPLGKRWATNSNISEKLMVCLLVQVDHYQLHLASSETEHLYFNCPCPRRFHSWRYILVCPNFCSLGHQETWWGQEGCSDWASLWLTAEDTEPQVCTQPPGLCSRPAMQFVGPSAKWKYIIYGSKWGGRDQ